MTMIPLWLVTATIGEHNNVELCVPAHNIIQAGERAGCILEGSCFSIHSCRFNYQIQSIAQFPPYPAPKSRIGLKWDGVQYQIQSIAQIP